ncbi:MAG: SLC13 family permease [Anaerovoracaceae bacterium]
MSLNKKLDKRVLGIIIAIVIIALTQVLPTSDTLSREALSSLGLFAAAIALWICESMAMAVSSLLIMVLMPYFNIMSLGELWPNFGGSAFFFVLATFALTASIESSTLPTRLIGWIVKISGSSSTKVVYGFIFGTAILSAIMSNFATAVMFLSISVVLIRANGTKKGEKSNFAKCLLIGVPVASNIGGFMTLAGTPTNIMGVEILESMTGITVTFVQWMVVGIPLGLLGCFVASFVITKMFKPEPLNPEAVEFYLSSREELPPLTTREKKALTIIAVMFLLWILGSWIPALNTSVVAIIGVAVLMLPGIEVLTWEQYSSKVDWNTCMVIGVVPVLVQGMVVTGASQWLVDTAFGSVTGWSWIAITIFTSVFIALLRNVVPTGVANFALLQVPLIQLAQATGVSPVYLIMILAYWCILVMILPFDPIFLIGYAENHYTVLDTIKSGVIMTIVLCLATGLLIPLLAGMMGF